MHNYLFKLKLQNNSKKINLLTTAILFNEGNTHFAFTPALQLTGYGNTQAEAVFSLQVVMQEYFTVTNDNNTLIADLQKIGWQLHPKTKKLQAPDFKTMLHVDDKLQNIVYNMPYTKSNVALAM